MLRNVSLLLLLLLIAGACGSQKSATSPSAPDIAAWPALPADGLQPWEQLATGGFVIDRRASAAADMEFAPGVEAFSSGGSTEELGEGLSLSAAPKQFSHAIYRLPLAGQQPGMLHLDVNLHAAAAGRSTYWVGVSDYAADAFHWLGGFTEPQVTLDLTKVPGELLSPLGNLFVAIVAFDGESFDVVGVGAETKSPGDTNAPDAPAALGATPVAGGLLLEWTDVVAADLAGYRVYTSFSPFTSTADPGATALPYLEGTARLVIAAEPGRRTFVAVSAVDVSGNESAVTPVADAVPLSGQAPLVLLLTDAVSGPRELTATLTATGAEVYDFDLDGDGDFEISGDTTGTALVDTSSVGILRPSVRGSLGGGSSVAFGSVSLLVSANSRPAASAVATPQQGQAPLDVQFMGLGEDADGTIAEYAWDTDGDGVYDANGPGLSAHSFSYGTPGLYNVKLRDTDDQGDWDVDTVAVQVLADPDNSAPQIDLFAVTPDDGIAPLDVTFTVTATDSDGTIVDYDFDFNSNGTFDATSIDGTAGFTYTQPGFYTARVRVTDNDGAHTDAQRSIFVSVEEVNQPPVAILTSPTPEVLLSATNDSGIQVQFDASSSYDPEGSDLIYTFSAPGSNPVSGSLPVRTLTITELGDVPVTLEVEDDHGTRDTATFLIQVRRFSTQGLHQGSAQDVAASSSQGSPPAVVFRDATNSDLTYIGCNDGFGRSWNPPVDIDTTGGVQPYIVRGESLVIVTYGLSGDLKFARSTDGGASFPVVVVANDNGTDNTGLYSSYASYEDRKFIAYHNQTDGTLMLTTTTDIDGSTWDPGVVIYSEAGQDVGEYTSMLIVEDRPAVAFYNRFAGSLMYMVANDPAGTDWPEPDTLDNQAGDEVGYFASMAHGNDGLPCIAYYDLTDNELWFVGADDVVGENWYAPVLVDDNGGAYCSVMLLDNQRIGISYMRDTADSPIYYAQSTDLTYTSFETTQAAFYVDADFTSGGVMANGQPYVAFYDGSIGRLSMTTPRSE